MPRFVETKITLTANQAAGVDPILDAETARPGNRQTVLLGNPGATLANVHLSTGAAHGTGFPLPGYGSLAFTGAVPGLDGALYVTGLATGDKLTLWTA